MELQRAVPVLTVADVHNATQEYAAVLGLDVIMDHGWIVTLADNEGHQLSVMTHDLTAPCNPDLSLEVADVDLVYARATAQGVEIVHPLQDEDWGVRRFFFRATDGQIVNVLTHRT